MRCIEGLGLPLSRALRRLAMAAVLACLASLALLVSATFADEPVASDPTAASDPASAEPAPEPPAASDPVAEPPVAEPAPEPSDNHPAHEPGAGHSGPGHPVADPMPVVEPVFAPLPVDLPVGEVPNPVATIEVPAGDPQATPADDRPGRLTAPEDTAPAAYAPSPTPSDPATDPAAALPVGGGVVVPEPESHAPAAWRWPSPAAPGSPALAPVLGATFLSSAPPVITAPSPLPAGGGTTSRHGGARHAPLPSRVAPTPWSPAGPASPVFAGAGAPGGSAGGIGGFGLASLLFVLLALAAPRRPISRPALAPVLSLRTAYAPARAPPVS